MSYFLCATVVCTSPPANEEFGLCSYGSWDQIPPGYRVVALKNYNSAEPINFLTWNLCAQRFYIWAPAFPLCLPFACLPRSPLRTRLSWASAALPRDGGRPGSAVKCKTSCTRCQQCDQKFRHLGEIFGTGRIFFWKISPKSNKL
jgi:hypothetical protein